MDNRVNNLEAKFTLEIAELRRDFTVGISKLREEIQDVRTEVRSEIAELRRSQQRWFWAVIIPTSLLIAQSLFR